MWSQMSKMLFVCIISLTQAVVFEDSTQNQRMREAEVAIAGAASAGSKVQNQMRKVEIILSDDEEEKVWEHMVLAGEGAFKLTPSSLSHAARSVAHSLSAPIEVFEFIDSIQEEGLPRYFSFCALASNNLGDDSCMMVNADYEGLKSSSLLQLEEGNDNVLKDFVRITWKAFSSAERKKGNTVAVGFHLSNEIRPVVSDKQGTHDKNHPHSNLLHSSLSSFVESRSSFWMDVLGIHTALSFTTDNDQGSSSTRMHLWYSNIEMTQVSTLVKDFFKDNSIPHQQLDVDEEDAQELKMEVFVDEMERRRLDANGYYYRAHCGTTSADWVYDDPGGCTGWSRCSNYDQCSGGGYSLCYCCPKTSADAGYYSLNLYKATCPCPGGQYSAGGTTSCSTCSAGYYSTDASSSCTACPAGTYSASSASSACTSCPAGQYQASTTQTSCNTCAIGYYSGYGDSSCTICPAGQYGTSSGASSCTACPAGQYQGSTGQQSCTSCDAGKYSASSASSCTSCPAGQYSGSSGSTACSNCDSGSYSTSSGSTGCTDCAPGQYSSSAGLTGCTSCPTGYYSASSGSVSCSACPSGYYASGTANSACSTCSSGTYSSSAASSCTDCDAGEYAASSASSACVDCAAGKYSPSSGSDSCTACAVGYYSASTGSTGCTACAAGKYTATTSTSSCISCPAGYYSVGTANTACTACPGGQFSSSTASTTCSTCSGGSYSLSASSGCTDCSSGTYAVAGDSSCTACAAGKYTPTTGYSACTNCLAGTFSAAQASACTDCSAGTYASTSQSTACTACPSGQYSSSDAASSCSSCAAGTYSPSTSSTSCTDCGTGTYSASGASICTDCAAGEYASSTGSTGCADCSAGKYSGTAASSCSDCAAGYYASSSGATSCVSCPAGTYSSTSASACTNCVAGTYSGLSASSSCTSCALGKYSETRASGCISCSIGQYASSEGSSTCSNCTAGQYTALVTTSVCTECPGGQYSYRSGMDHCDSCPSGTYSLASASSCTSCPDGKTSADESSDCEGSCEAGTYISGTACVSCPVGQYSEAGDSTCTDCPAGYYAASEGTASVCTICPAGYYAPTTGLSSVTICPSGTYSSAGASSCSTCFSGYYSSAGSSSCDSSCPAGTYSGSGSATCIDCDAGYYSLAAASSCSVCAAGHYSGSGAAACTECDAGDYASGTANSACTACALGMYSGSTGATVCTSCDAGTYAQSTGASSCTDCPTGFYSGTGASYCVACPSGYYASSTASTSCTACSAGTYSASQASACTSCGAGKYSFTASSACTNCVAGTYSLGGASECSYCNNGTYSASAGSSSCLTCEAGKYTVATGAFTACTSCSKGTYMDTTGASTCVNCAAGQYASTTGATTCSDCSAGYICLEGSSKKDEYDCVNATEPNPANFYCPAGSAKRTVVPEGTYSIPDDSNFNNRVNYATCPKTSVCLKGVQYTQFIWDTGTCADAADSSGSVASITTSVDENADGASVGGPQFVLSPLAVDFQLDPSSDSASGGSFTLFVNKSTATVLVDSPGGLNYEAESSYTVLLYAISNGSFINCSMAVSVNDINEKPTIDVGTPPTRNVSEAAAVNDYVNGPPIKATDPDTSDEHVYSLLYSNPPDGLDYFGIGGCSGLIYVQQEGLDVLVQSSYNLTVRVRDDAGETLSDIGNLTVFVMNANDAPYFTVNENEVYCYIDENSPENSTVLGNNCSAIPYDDPDAPFGDEVVWTISRADVDDTFKIDSETGVLYVNHGADLNYEDQTEYSLEVTITDEGGLEASMDIVVHIIDVNEAPTTDYPTVFVAENTPAGTLALAATSLQTNDVDSEEFTYRIIPDGNSTSRNGTIFNITKGTGALYVGPAGLNYEKKDSYILTVETTDGGLNDDGINPLSSTTLVHITVTDVNEEPTLSVADEYWVNENAIEVSTVGYVYVIDPDVGQSHSFSSDTTDIGVVASASKVGLLYLGDTAELDYETTPTFDVDITVSDGSLSSTSTITIMVNNSNDAPVCSSTLGVMIDENSVGLLARSAGESFGLSAAFNYTDQDDVSLKWGQATMNVSGTQAGVLFVEANCLDSVCADRMANLTLMKALDYETTPSATFVVTVTDGGGLSCSTFVTITVEDVNERPYFLAQYTNKTFYVANDAANGESLGFVTAEDEDSSDTAFGTLTYSLVYDGSVICPNGEEIDRLSTVAIDATTGEFTVTNKSALIYPREFCVGINATDGGGLAVATTAQFIVSESNTQPTMNDLTVYVLENTADNTMIAQLNGTDEDPGSNGLSFSIESCTAGTYANLSCSGRSSMFEIVANPDSLLSAFLYVGTSQLDYEDSAVFGSKRPPTYQLTLEVYDSDPVPLSSFATVTVVVVDVDEYPEFSDSSFSLAENEDSGTTVGDISSYAIDEDDGSSITFSLDDTVTFHGEMTYTKCATTCLNAGLQVACIDSSTDNSDLIDDYNAQSSYTSGYVWLGYTDPDGTDSYEWVAPGCTSTYTNWDTDSPSSTSKRCALMDVSTGEWSDAACSSTPAVGATLCACEPGPFSISSAGVISTTGILDYEDMDTYSLIAIATDNTDLSTEATVTITVTDVEEAPVITKGQTFTVAEDGARSTDLGNVIATDDDNSDSVTYTLLNGTETFYISTSDGDLFVGGTDTSTSYPLDFECDTEYRLAVKVTDLTGLTDTTIVTVIITDVNDLTISAVDYGNGGTGLATLGGEPVVITGTNFGPCENDGMSVVTATYSNGLDGLTYVATGCNISSTDNTEITCRSAPGVGSGHTWNVTVDSRAASFIGGQSAIKAWNIKTTDLVTTYNNPSISSISSEATNMDSAGGATITITGVDLAPYACTSVANCGSEKKYALSSSSLTIAYQFYSTTVASAASDSLSYADFSCSNPTVTVEGTELTCTSAEGLGNTLYWMVTVGITEATSLASTSTLFSDTSYAVPTIASLSQRYDIDNEALGYRGMFDLDTSGGDYVLITGTGFGPDFDSLSSAAALYVPEIIVTYGPAGGGVNKGSNDLNAVKYTAADCAIFTAHTEVLCTSVAGVGKNLTWVVTIAGQEGSSLCIDEGSDYCAYNASTSYAPPVIKPTGSGTTSAVSGAGVDEASTRGGQLLTIVGIEFGPAANEEDPIVTYGPLSEIDRYVAEDCSISVDYSTISCLTTEGVGADHYIVLTIGNQVSNVYESNITYSSPNVIEYDTQYDSNADGASTRGGQWVVITGKNFGTVAENRLEEVRYSSSTDSASDDYTEIFYPCTSAVDPVTGVSSTDAYYSCPAGYNRPDTCLMITGVIDASLSGGLPKAMELYAACDIADLSYYGLGVDQNGGGSDGQEYTFPDDEMVQGDFIYVAYTDSTNAFETWFGFAPDYTSGALNMNGDQDAFALYFDGSIVDMYGYSTIVGDDYNSWNFQDGWAYRVNGSIPDTTFDVSDWTVSFDVLDSYTSNTDADTGGVGFPTANYDQGSWDPYEGCERVNPCPCEVVVDHTKINCSTVAGAGSGFTWVVTIDGQISTASTTNYGIPVVYELSGYGAVNASTYGGQDVTITGNNFGPITGAGASGNESFLDSVTYGPGGTEYTAVDCAVTVDHTEIVCTTVPGVGSQLSYVVTVEGQSSSTSTVYGSYAPPTLLGAYPMHVGTEGGSIHVVNGTDLGMATSDAYLNVYLDGDPVYIDGHDRLTVYPATSAYMSSSAIDGWMDGDGGSPWIEALSFEMPAMGDEDHAKVLSVVIGNKQFGGASTTANSVNMLYKAPRLDEIQNTAGTPIGTTSTSDLVLTGSNFGSLGTVYYNGAAVTSSYISSWKDDEIQLTVIGLNGNITVAVGDYTSEKLSFDDFSPILYTSFSEYMPDSNGYRTDAYSDSTVIRSDYTNYEDYIAAYNAGGPDKRNLTIAGLYFGTIEENLNVYVGDAECVIRPGSLTELTSIIAADTARSITCQVPEGSGIDNEVVLVRSLKSSYVANASSALYLDYQPPVITGVSPSKIHTNGGTVTITGRNFGTRSKASAYYGETKLTVLASGYTDEMAYLTIPEGDGNQKTLSFTVNEQTDYVYSTAAASGLDDDDESYVAGFAYYAPNVTGIETSWGGSLSTTGGTVTIVGTDFGLEGNLDAYIVRAIDPSSRRRSLMDSYDSEDYEVMDYEVTVNTSAFSYAVITIGEGEGLNELLVNVSGQITLTPLNYGGPNISMVTPNYVTTVGGEGQVNVTGINFGLGEDFTLKLSGPGSGDSVHCDHEWTQADLDDDNSGLVFDYTHSTLSFVPPEGQCDVSMNLTLTVADQESNALPFWFSPPVITMLSFDSVNELGSNCNRDSSAGCGLTTEGGYTVTITGENFGVDDQQVYFNDIELDTFDYNFIDHTTATFVVPEGVGTALPVKVKVGGRSSNGYAFSYDPPYITSITPNEFDAASDLLEIYGNNFGETLEDAGDIYIRVGNNTCSSVTVGTYTTNIWQQTVGGTSYLWCSIESATVGEKDVFISVAGQNTSLTEDESGVRGVCSSGYYGQQAWTVFSDEDGECASGFTCDPADTNINNVDQKCTSYYDADAGEYTLINKFSGSGDDDVTLRCENDWVCMINAEMSTGLKTNCTVLTMEDEYCAECPTGSECEDFTTVYSVEPVAIAGYWREGLVDGTDGFHCDDLRQHRPYCWDFQPCAPTEACLGDNTCAKGYTDDKCAQCCDQTYGKTDQGKIDCYLEDGTQLLYHRIYGKCEKCPDNILWLLGGALVAIIIAALVGYRMHQKKVDLGIFSIGVDYFQVLAIFASTEVEWPTSVTTVFRYMSVFNFSINLTPPECAFEVSYRVKWMVIEWFPTVMFGIIFLLWCFSFFYFRYCSSQNTKKVRDLRNGLISGSLLIMYILYLNISENTLDPLNCMQIESEDGTKTDRQYMVSQPSEVCWVTNRPTLQQDLVPYAWIFFFLYTIGYPFCVGCILLRRENTEKAMNDQYLRCMGTGSKKETNKAYYNFRTKFSTLYFKFKPKYYFWILLIVFRKLLIVSFTLLFHINATMQLSMILLVIFISYTLQVKHDPYLSRADYEEIVGDMDPEHYQSLVGPYGTCPQPKGIGYDKLLEEAQSRAVSTRLSLATTIDKMREKGFTREDLKAGGEEVLKALFNYNTVESTLLFCAILVCLFGIMFASEFMEPGDILYERLGELTLAVIFISLSYYFVVVWSEVVAVMFPQLACTWLSGAVDGKRDQLLDADGNVIQSGEEDEDEALFAKMTQGMSDEERDEYRIRQVERDIIYEDTNPIVLRDMERQMTSLTKNALEADSDEDDNGPALLSLEDQIALQETVAGLMEENKKLKKKAADAAAQQASKMAAPSLKKMKNKVGKGKKAAEEPPPAKEEPNKVPARTKSSTRPSGAMDLGDLYAAHAGGRFDQVAHSARASFVTSSNPLRGGPGSGGALSPKRGDDAVESASNPLLNPMSSGAKKSGARAAIKKSNKKAARMAASDFDDENVL